MSDTPYAPARPESPASGARAPGSPGLAAPDPRFDSLHADARSTVAQSAATLRTTRERYREAYLEELGRWHAARDLLARRERRLADDGARPDGPVDTTIADLADLVTLRAEVEELTAQLGLHQQELAKLELAHQSLESTRLFLERGDASLISSAAGAAPSTEMQMRIVEAQEAERSRLAQEIHDGPAQGLSNAIFQVEYIERVMEQDGRLARTELRFLRELLRRELGDVRSFISQLRPPLLEQLGLDGAIADTVETVSALGGLEIETDLQAPEARLDETQQIVVLRVAQEALQNVRKHAQATRVGVRTRLEDDRWLLEVRDDGRGFDGSAVAGSRRNFGLQFMRERAELIGATLDIRSAPDAGTTVRLAIPIGGEDTR